MIRDLAAADENQTREADILVVGAGTAGLLIAVLLSRKGSHVVVVESRGERQAEDRHPLNEVVQLGETYHGAEDGRFRCLGGTSTRWGGALIPFMVRDFDVAAGWDARWPVGVEAFTQYARQVERIFELTETPYEIPEVLGSGAGANAAFVPRLAKWAPFVNRNMATLLRRDIQRETGPEIWLGATVCEFSLEPSGRLGSVAAKNLNGRRLSIKAREVVFAAGAIESTRLLLLVDRQHDDRLFEPHGILGRYFYDHLSVPTSRVFVRDARRLNQITGFRFEGKTMRNLRFEPSFELRKQHGLPTGFAHISFVSELPSGFDALRSILRGARKENFPPSATRRSWRPLFPGWRAPCGGGWSKSAFCSPRGPRTICIWWSSRSLWREIGLRFRPIARMYSAARWRRSIGGLGKQPLETLDRSDETLSAVLGEQRSRSLGPARDRADAENHRRLEVGRQHLSSRRVDENGQEFIRGGRRREFANLRRP